MFIMDEVVSETGCNMKYIESKFDTSDVIDVY